ncbi:MAG: hypothetical protein M3355_06265 [Actinomycetota bacterium]|nr:hypothetical protein [Actinomycetota bacterium]
MAQEAGLHTHRGPVSDPQHGDGLRKLLDHIAAELATEYVHLMEAAADADRKQLPSSPPDQEGSSG